MKGALDKVAALDATIAAVDRAMNTTEIEGMVSVNSAYMMCSAEIGPLMQYLGAGYYVKRPPMKVKQILEQQRKVAKEEAEATTRVTKDVPSKKMEDDTIEIVERYDSSDE
ncbi:hypothetical protein X943_002597 [Babesia divergens]|uniref:Uncharacterized protein n=1 Tax=Babesia divergens TaxID=32595 RepID=A0AAD9GK47_BABDI|nr:hypothetical protein X943_002597 [Babesia divergens]